MDSKNKFWRGVMVGVLVTALVCLITVGASAGIYMFGRRVIDNQTQVQKSIADARSFYSCSPTDSYKQ